MSKISRDHPLHLMFSGLVENQVQEHVATTGHEDVQLYLTDMLVAFIRLDRVFAIKDKQGRPLRSVFEMMAEADVRLNADSFERERQVHKHIGDFILFWSGVYPDHLRRVKLQNATELVCDYARQARESYEIVSSFDYKPFDSDAPTFRKLSENFDAYRFVLGRVAERANLYVA